MEFMCNERNHSICYITTTYEVHTFKNKTERKRHFCLLFSLLYLLIRSYKLAIIETRAYDIAHDEDAMISVISQIL